MTSAPARAVMLPLASLTLLAAPTTAQIPERERFEETGELDYRTPMSETEQYYGALKLVGVPTAMVRIPEASHGIAGRPSQLLAKVTHILGWFDRYPRRSSRPVS